MKKQTKTLLLNVLSITSLMTAAAAFLLVLHILEYHTALLYIGIVTLSFTTGVLAYLITEDIKHSRKLKAIIKENELAKHRLQVNLTYHIKDKANLEQYEAYLNSKDFQNPYERGER